MLEHSDFTAALMEKSKLYRKKLECYDAEDLDF